MNVDPSQRLRIACLALLSVLPLTGCSHDGPADLGESEAPLERPTAESLRMHGAPVARNGDGRLELFYAGADGQLHHKWQVVANGEWVDGWHGLGGKLASAPVATSNVDGRLEVFALGTDNQLYHLWQLRPGGEWSDWGPLGGSWRAPPAVARNADGRLELFSLRDNQEICHIWQTGPGGGWSDWECLGGTFVSGPAVTVNADGRLELFAVGEDGGLYSKFQLVAGGGWSDGWLGMGGRWISAPAAVPNADGRLELFAVGTDRALYHRWQLSPGGGWSDWAGLGGSSRSNPIASRNADGRLEIFYAGEGGEVVHLWQGLDSQWSPPESLGGNAILEPAVGSNADGRLELFIAGSDKTVQHKWQGASGWSPDWPSLGMGGGGVLVLASSGPASTGGGSAPGSLVSMLSVKPYVEQSCSAASYPGWPYPAQNCRYSAGGITTNVVVANPSPERTAQWIVDAARYIPALDRLRDSDRGAYEEGLKAIGLAMLYQSSRIFPLSGGVIENMGSGYVNYNFEKGVTSSCGSGCYCRINSLHRTQWCQYQAGIGAQSYSSCLGQVGSSGFTSGWANQCLENHKRSWESGSNEHFRARAFVANQEISSRCGGGCSGSQVVQAVRSAYGL